MKRLEGPGWGLMFSFQDKDQNEGLLMQVVGRCRLTVLNPVLKAPMVSALETINSSPAFKICLQFQLAPLHSGGC
jgi:hypothetical protein